jgi:hypothetical protein
LETYRFPKIVVSTLICNPKSGEIDAVAEPLAICGVTSAFTPVNPLPSP